MKQTVLELYPIDIEEYERVINHVNNSLIDTDLPIKNRKILEVATILYPTNTVHNLTLGNINIREILLNNNNNNSKNINEYCDLIIDCINNNTILKNCITLDSYHPKSIFKKAKQIMEGGLPLTTKYLPLVKSSSSINALCFRQKKYNSFMSYLYYVGLFLSDNINIKNTYINNTSQQYTDYIRELILLYGREEHINLEMIEKWSNNF